MRSIHGLIERSQIPHHELVLGGNQGVEHQLVHVVNRWDTYSTIAHLLMIN
jgi:hypothetical protein